MEHFGVTVRAGKYGLKMNRETYATINNRNSFYEIRDDGEVYYIKFPSLEGCYEDREGRFYTQAWCEKHQKNCLENYDLNMQYFARLDRERFEKEIQRFLKRHRGFAEVGDLKEYTGQAGYYLMVLDEYKQIYIGTSKNIRKRIQAHWTGRRPFDRLLFPIGAVQTSGISIDSFRALDTTRLYAWKTRKIYEKEDKLIRKFSREFVCNRIGGGKLDAVTGGLYALATRNKREL